MIPVCDLSRQHQQISNALLQACTRVQKRGIFILGPEVEQFEEQFSHYLGAKYAIGVASGTDALSLALLALGIGIGDEVIVPANAYPTVFGVTAIGAIPRLVDIDPVTFTVDAEKLQQAITKKTKAIIPVHLYGQPADIENILTIVRREDIPVIEDCAQATGAEIFCHSEAAAEESRRLPRSGRDPSPRQPAGFRMTKKKKAGTLGDIGCFSFYPTKNLGCLGDGGMMVTNNQEIAKRIRRLRMYGEASRYNSIELGRNSRLDELQAAFLLVKLKYLDQWNQRRREIAKQYYSRIRNYELGITNKNQIKNLQPTTYNLQLPLEASYSRHVYHLYVIRSKRRDRLKHYLEEQGVGTAIHYPTPIHLVPSMKYLGYTKGDFPESERACEEVLSLPIYPELTDAEVQQVANAVTRFQ